MAQQSPTTGRDNHEQCTQRTLTEFRLQEGRENRKRRLLALWRHIRVRGYNFDREPSAKALGKTPDSTEKAKKLRAAYEHELLGRVGGWKQFVEYAEAKEVELWTIFHDELDLDRNGHLEAEELESALRKAGITLSPNTLSEFMTYLTSSPQSRIVTFAEFRDFLLLLPRKISTTEIYKYYEMNKFLGDDGKGVARVTMEGDVSLSAEDKPPDKTVQAPAIPQTLPPVQSTYVEHEEEQEDDDDTFDDSHGWLEGHTALKFLLAGGIAGAVSRTCTAPFDRLKIFLITRPPDLGGALLAQTDGVNIIRHAVRRIYSEGGVFAFWTGNGLSVAKIFPESAIKFFAYESAKRMFATYWDHVDDSREISGVSRFLSGGIGGISSQLCIYPVETLKTQMMSNTGTRRTLMSAARHVWRLGGFRAYYRGLTVGLVGVFPYSAIDMSTFEALKLAYLRSTGKDEPGMLALLAFGSVSGSVGATSVYPMNLVRTKLQASGSSGHPERYTGVFDVASKTWAREGWRGFYRGLFPTLAKVVPAVSISYVVYEHSKRRLGV
ncbi:mitochondrial carrier [Desarmillaria ectypa]|nr:mitochondrial carrier [Desarmillaria ectypa]